LSRSLLDLGRCRGELDAALYRETVACRLWCLMAASSRGGHTRSPAGGAMNGSRSTGWSRSAVSDTVKACMQVVVADARERRMIDR
jgi:hypothetical protein